MVSWPVLRSSMCLRAPNKINDSPTTKAPWIPHRELKLVLDELRTNKRPIRPMLLGSHRRADSKKMPTCSGLRDHPPRRAPLSEKVIFIDVMQHKLERNEKQKDIQLAKLPLTASVISSRFRSIDPLAKMILYPNLTSKPLLAGFNSCKISAQN